MSISFASDRREALVAEADKTPESEDLVRVTARLESSARSYPSSFPITFVAGEGHYLIAADGARYLDCLTGAGVLLLGHNHPRVVAAIRAAEQPILSSLDLVTRSKYEFLRAFRGILPGEIADQWKVHFCGPTGSDSVEAALKLARLVTGRSGIFAFMGAYHGMSQGALGVSSSLRLRRAGLRVRDEVTFLPFPYGYRNGGAGEDLEALVDRCVAHLRMLLEDDHSGVEKPGLVIMEAVQGEGGNIVAPAGFIRAVRELCDRHGILLCVDEIQSGMGRTGRWFAFEHAGIEPDMICVSKGIGGGFPLSLLVYDGRLDEWKAGDHIGTFRGQDFAFRAGRATIEVILESDLLSHAEAAGRHLRQGLESLSHMPGFAEVRGLGLFIGMECGAVGSRSAGDVAKAIQATALRKGVLLERGGREGSVLRFLPPLTVELGEVDRICDAIRAGLRAIQG
jgi:diaminobutyrate-2-oxoglutarate transaminase